MNGLSTIAIGLGLSAVGFGIWQHQVSDGEHRQCALEATTRDAADPALASKNLATCEGNIDRSTRRNRNRAFAGGAALLILGAALSLRK